MPGYDVFIGIAEEPPLISVLRISPLGEGITHPEHDQHEGDYKQRSEVLAIHSLTFVPRRAFSGGTLASARHLLRR